MANRKTRNKHITYETDPDDVAQALVYLTHKKHVNIDNLHLTARAHLMCAALLVSQKDFNQAMYVEEEASARTWIESIVVWLHYFDDSERLGYELLSKKDGVFIRNHRHNAENSFSIHCFNVTTPVENSNK